MIEIRKGRKKAFKNQRRIAIAVEKIIDAVSYLRILKRRPHLSLLSEEEKRISGKLVGYPRNHNYMIYNRSLFPNFQLFQRWKRVISLYPRPLKNFLDIGCCKGFYVLDAALRESADIALGIDVHEPFLHLSNKAKAVLRAPNARFCKANLTEIAEKPESFGGPFQVVLLIGTYHYLFWGSKLCDESYNSHYEILSRVAAVCSEILIFSARLEIDRLPSRLRAKATKSKECSMYTTERFLKEASTFFDIHHTGYLGKYPLYAMRKK